MVAVVGAAHLQGIRCSVAFPDIRADPSALHLRKLFVVFPLNYCLDSLRSREKWDAEIDVHEIAALPNKMSPWLWQCVANWQSLQANAATTRAEQLEARLAEVRWGTVSICSGVSWLAGQQLLHVKNDASMECCICEAVELKRKGTGQAVNIYTCAALTVHCQWQCSSQCLAPMLCWETSIPASEAIAFHSQQVEDYFKMLEPAPWRPRERESSTDRVSQLAGRVRELKQKLSSAEGRWQEERERAEALEERVAELEAQLREVQAAR